MLVYEFILVDTDSLEISYIQDNNTFKRAFSKCKILKVTSLRGGTKICILIKKISQSFSPPYFKYHDYKIAWFNTFCYCSSDRAWFFHFRKDCQKQIPIWFQEWFSIFDPTQEIFVSQV